MESNEPVYFNSQLIRGGISNSLLKNRAFLYGDGLFETMVISNGSLPLLHLHLERIKAGMSILGIPHQKAHTEQIITDRCLALKKEAKIEGDVRVRWQVWREGSGRYTPIDPEVYDLLTIEPFKYEIRIKEKVNVSQKIHLHHHAYSHLKTISALPYVMAGLENQALRTDDLILTDNFGNIAELTASNILWRKDDQYYTPSLETGCIKGVMRTYLMQFLNNKGAQVQTGKYPLQGLLEADAAWSMNVTGIHPIHQIEGHILEICEDEFKNITSKIF